MAAGGFIRKLRILVLLAILLVVGLDTYLTKARSTDWDRPLLVLIYPINADSSEATQRYIDALTSDQFDRIQTFFGQEAKFHELPLGQPIQVTLAHTVHSHPPETPDRGDTLAIIWFGLALRFWAFRVDESNAAHGDIRVFVRYYDPQKRQRLGHSVGLQKGLLGLVNAFADRTYTQQNNVVISHEVLHTLGATDKYELATGNPKFPEGYAQPKREPLYPQKLAEIMAGRIPLTAHKSTIPRSLGYSVIGDLTAQEIKWWP